MLERESKLQIGDLCEAFEKEWDRGISPDLSLWLSRVDDCVQPELLIRLARIDIENRRRNDPMYSADEFLESHGLSTADLQDATLSVGEPRIAAGILSPGRTLRAGERLGKYEIRSEVGRGGFGVVYRAFDTSLKRFVALKIPRDALDDDSRARFLKEAETAASLEHPGLVTVFESGEIDGVCYIATSYCGGTNLAQWLRQQSHVSRRVAAQLVRDLAESMQHAHDRGIVHRDLKPGNVMLMSADADETGDTAFRTRITDFGLAKLMDERLVETASSVVLGTPNYMAPEQVAPDSGSVPPEAADIYSLGVILYELLTGVKPFERDNVLKTMSAIETADVRLSGEGYADIPSALETICLKAMARNPDDRYDSCAAFAEDLSCFLHGQPIQARRPTLMDRLKRWSMSPARKNEAGVLSMVLGLGMPFWMIMITAVIWWEGLKVQIASEIVPQTLILSIVLMLPLAWIGYQTRRGHRIWTAIGFWSSLLNTVMVCAPLCGYVIIFPELYKQFPLGKIVVFTILTLVFGVQALQYSVLMYALRKSRQDSCSVSR